jgi:hypothetical protein
MIDAAERRCQIIRHLEDALALADELDDGQTGSFIGSRRGGVCALSGRR